MLTLWARCGCFVFISRSSADTGLPFSQSKAAPKARTKKEEKVFLEIEARFDRPRGGGRGGRGGDDRGGRGARGGGRARGAPRGGSRPAGNYNSAQAVNVDDETAFPSLS
jgi:plasminogen activator inhibitor 1 RNA-binding protein